MRKLIKKLLFTLFILSAIGSLAQDVIVKTNGDKIDCLIISVNDNQVAFKIKGASYTQYLGKTFVKEIVYGQKTEAISPKQLPTEEEIVAIEKILDSKEPLVNTEKSEKDTCDNIILRSGEEISSKVIEVGVTEIKYRKCPKVSGPSYSVLKSDVFMIQYANGNKDIMPEEKKAVKESSEIKKERKQFILFKPGKPMAAEKTKFKNYTTFGISTGPNSEIHSWNINSSIHYQPLYYFSVGLGSGIYFQRYYSVGTSYRYISGVKSYSDGGKYWLNIPLVGELKFILSRNRFSPIFSFNAGYLFAFTKEQGYFIQRWGWNPNSTWYDYHGSQVLSGPMINGEIGIRLLNYNRIGLVVSIAFSRNYLKLKEKYIENRYNQANSKERVSKVTYDLLGLNVGITF